MPIFTYVELTPAQLREYTTRPDHCPFCNCKIIRTNRELKEPIQLDLGEDRALHHRVCTQCKREWADVFSVQPTDVVEIDEMICNVCGEKFQPGEDYEVWHETLLRHTKKECKGE
jgi:uncharacterized protein with PIN domain